MVFIISAYSPDLDYCHFRLNLDRYQEIVTGLSYCGLNFFLAESYDKNSLSKAFKLYHEYLKFEDIFTIIIIETAQSVSLWIEDNRLIKIRSLDNIEIQNFLSRLLIRQQNLNISPPISNRIKTHPNC